MNLEDIKNNFPFLSIIRYKEIDFVGIIQNCDDKIITFYDFESLKSEGEKKELLNLGDIWYWESNRLLPINIFLNPQLKKFRHCLRTVTRKEAEIVFGIEVSLNKIIQKRIKRRQIQLVRKI